MLGDHAQGQPFLPTSSCPVESTETVKQLLEHLYDLPFLQQHPLAVHAAAIPTVSASTPSQALRELLVRSIEIPGSPPNRTLGVHDRHLKLVYLHYVDGMTIQEAAHNLAISERQAYRDLQRGAEAVAGAFWEMLGAARDVTGRNEISSPMSMQAEVDRVMLHVTNVDLAALVNYAIQAVQKIAQQRQLTLLANLPTTPCIIRANKVVAQQLVVCCLSQIIQSLESTTVQLIVINRPRFVELEVRIEGDYPSASVTDFDALATQLFDRLGWSYAWRTDRSAETTFSMTAPTDLRYLLVIDDNESLPDLLDRYLMNMPYRIATVTNPSDGLRLAQELLPDVIMLDILMPNMDGWELLQRLRNCTRTADIPIVVCSVFNDPELAQSLGATLFLPKPLSRELFLGALQRIEMNACDESLNILPG